MIDELMEPFRKMYESEGDNLILKGYQPKEGKYVFVNLKDMSIEHFEITKKTSAEGYFKEDLLKACDYYSNLLDMNKPMDPKKVIHSNQLYAIWIKQNVINEKLNDTILEGYRNNIVDPLNKYKKGKAKSIYEKVAAELPELEDEHVEKIFTWIKENIHKLEDVVDYTSKNYLKIFFIQEDDEETKKLFKQEYKRYVIPNIYNSNDYNQEVAGDIYGLPNNCMGLNAKKPFLGNVNRKVAEPYMVDSQEILLQKALFDYLYNLAKENKRLVYANDKKIDGKAYDDIIVSLNKYDYLLQITYAKNVEIQSFYNLTVKDEESDYGTDYYKIFSTSAEDITSATTPSTYFDREKLLEHIDSDFFSKRLKYNFATEDGDIDVKNERLKNMILKYKASLFNWFYLGDSSTVSDMTRDLYMDAVQLSLEQGYFTKAKEQFNLGLSLERKFKGGNTMEELQDARDMFRTHVNQSLEKKDWKIESDDEYFYGVGQILGYLNAKRNAKNKTAAFVTNICNTRDINLFKTRVYNLIQKHDHNIETHNLKLDNAIANVLAYQTDCPVNSMMVMVGFLRNNVFFEKNDKSKGEK